MVTGASVVIDVEELDVTGSRVEDPLVGELASLPTGNSVTMECVGVVELMPTDAVELVSSACEELENVELLLTTETLVLADWFGVWWARLHLELSTL